MRRFQKTFGLTLLILSASLSAQASVPSASRAAELLQRSLRKDLSDRDRTTALLAAQQADAATVEARLPRLLADPSWMVRSAALRFAGRRRTSPQLIARVATATQDAALVVRWEAMKTLKLLVALPGQPRAAHPELEGALLRTLRDTRNFTSAGEPLWVPPLALDLLMRTASPTRLAALREELTLLSAQKRSASWKRTLQTAAAHLNSSR